MKRYILIAGLLFALSGLCALAQTSTTPGVPAPGDHNPPTPQATAPDQQSTPDQDRSSSSDQQQSPGTPRHDADRNSQPSDQDRQDDSARPDRDAQTPDVGQDRRDDGQSPQATVPDHDRGDQYDRSPAGYGGQIEDALRRASIEGVNVKDDGAKIELAGTVGSSREHQQAVSIAQSYAHGREVVDHIQVSR